MPVRQAIQLSLFAGATVGIVHGLDVALALGAGLPWGGRLAAIPGVIGAITCLALACAPAALVGLEAARRAPAKSLDGAWLLAALAAAAPTLWAAHRLYRFWASQTLDFPDEAGLGVAAAVAVVAGAGVLAARYALRPVAERVVERSGRALWVLLPAALAAPLYGVASRTMPSVHLDDRLLPYVLALIGLAGLGWAAARPSQLSDRRLAGLCALAALLTLVPGEGGRKVMRRAAPLADAVSSLALDLADRDGDGHASRLAGGSDCDDGDPAIQPGAPETPGNGVDDNCAAGDLAPADAEKARISLGVGASAPGLADAGAAPPTLMVLITVDALRADRLHPATMPRTWALAAQGTRFDKAYAAGSHTQSALPPLLTGQYLGRMIQPGPQGMRFSVGGTLAGLLASRGWHTIALQTAGLPGPLLSGFSVRIDLSDLGHDFKGLTTTPLLVRELIAALKARPAGRPAFAWLHTMDVHAPYRPSYDAQVAQTDAALGVLYDHIDQHEPPGAAVIAVSADHGEALGERGRFGHGRTLEDDQVLVPLVLSGGPIRKGHLAPGVVEVLDLPPTLVALAGLPPAPWMDGRSLLPVIAGQRRPGGQRAFMEVRGLGGSFLRAAATPYATVVRDLRRDLEWIRPPDAPSEALTQARTLLLAWEEGVLTTTPPPPR